MEDVEWMTTQEAADRLGVTTARIRQMLAENQIEAQKVGGKYRGQWQIKASEIELLRHQKGKTPAMRVKNKMTPNPIVASIKTNFNDAARLMKQNNIQHLIIVDAKGKPAGIVTQADMLRIQPSPVTTLNVFEIASYLDNITMESVMTSPVLGVDESCSITNAAKFMLNNKIDSLVVTHEDNLVGIITIADIFRTFIEITGGYQSGSRIEARIPNSKGHLAPFMQAFSNAGSYIVSLAINNTDDSDYGYMDIKERGGNDEDIRRELDKLGYVEIISFRHSEEDKLLTFNESSPKLKGMG